MRERFELSGKRKMEYLTDRWSAKELQRQWEQDWTGWFQDLEILNDAPRSTYFPSLLFLGRYGFRSVMET